MRLPEHCCRLLLVRRQRNRLPAGSWRKSLAGARGLGLRQAQAGAVSPPLPDTHSASFTTILVLSSDVGLSEVHTTGYGVGLQQVLWDPQTCWNTHKPATASMRDSAL